MGVQQCPLVALCFATAAVSATCGDGDGQCSAKGSFLLQQATKPHRTARTPFEEKRWIQAVKEEGLSVTAISDFGLSVPKLPRSAVVKLQELARKTPKRHTYNFMGRLRGSPGFNYGFTELERRAWIIPFVLSNFRAHDYLKVTDPHRWFKETLGRFDYSLTSRRVYGGPDALVDLTYFETLAASNFTLCPGGDTAWSIRSYEVALMRSICLIRDPKDDWNPADARSYDASGRRHMERLWAMYRYRLLNESRHSYDQALVDHNYRVFIKYQTFMEGDNVPPEPGAGGAV